MPTYTHTQKKVYILVYSYRRILYSNKKRTVGTCQNMDESHKHHVKQKNSDKVQLNDSYKSWNSSGEERRNN